MQNYQITFCTVCMNRLEHISKTLRKNITDNGEYPDASFLLLDYNSEDGLEDYIKNGFAAEIASGRLTYYKTVEPEFFNRSHSRNIAFKLAKGDLICNVDADNFTGKGFAAHLNKVFNSWQDIFLSTVNNLKKEDQSDVLGRICIKKEDFLKLGGFDERMVNYGFEDYDLIYRAAAMGLKNVSLYKNEFLKSIVHEDSMRMVNEFPNRNFRALYIRYLTPASSQIIILFEKQHFAFATIQNNFEVNMENIHKSSQRREKFEYSIIESEWMEGDWQKEGNNIVLSKNNKEIKRIAVGEDQLPDDKMLANALPCFSQINSTYLIGEALFFFSQLKNRMIMESNQRDHIIAVNANGFGKATLFMNFSETSFTLG